MSADAVNHSQLLAFAHQDLACYSIAQWPEFKLAPHHGMIISKLEAVEQGEIKRLMIFLPPRHGKSFITSSIFPAWFLGRHPQRHVISQPTDKNCLTISEGVFAISSLILLIKLFSRTAD
jgi:hypothetical protein